MSTRTKILAAVGALAFLVIVLSRGGEESSAQLQALEADPMATYVPPGGTLVDTDTQNEGTSLGKPVASVLATATSLGEFLWQPPREAGQVRGNELYWPASRQQERTATQ